MTLKAEHAALGLPGYYEEGSEQKAERGYIGWCPGADFLSARTGNGWESAIRFESSADFISGFVKGSDVDLNLVADFYFDHEAPSKDCQQCEMTGYGPEAKVLSQSFGEWGDKLTADEIDMLKAEGRTADNPFVGHDCINRMLLVECRARRLGIKEIECSACNGRGSVDTGPERLILNVWLLHPRKGCGRSIVVDNVAIDDLRQIKEWLRKSYERHTNHFAWAITP